MDRKKIETQIAALPICAYAFFPVSDIPLDRKSTRLNSSHMA